MASFATLPPEILAKITFYLSSVECVLRLPGCGNAGLNTRLRSGGITRLDYTINGLSQRIMDFVQSLRLQSFTFTQSSERRLPLPAIHQLLDGLSSSIRHLSLTYSTLDILYRDRCRPSASSPHTWLPGACAWIIRDTFPELTSLEYYKSHYDTLGSLTDPFFQVEFLRGLPASLTELKLPAPLEILINLDPALPPNLMHYSHSYHVPTVDLQLASLTVNISSAMLNQEEQKQKTRVDLPDFGRWQVAALDTLVIPKHLTSLTATCTSHHFKSAFLSSRTWPATLKTFYITSAGSTWDSVDELFWRMPPSVTDLMLKIDFKLSKTPTETHAIRVLPGVKTFYISLQNNAHFMTKLYTEIINRLPYVEDFATVIGGCASVGFGVQHLELFEGRLHSLTAPFAMECFPHGDGPYPLGQLLPKLQNLTFQRVNWGGNLDLNFAAIPASVTRCELTQMGLLDTKYLHLLELCDDPTAWQLSFSRPVLHFTLTTYPPSSDVTSSSSPPEKHLCAKSPGNSYYRKKKVNPNLETSIVDSPGFDSTRGSVTTPTITTWLGTESEDLPKAALNELSVGTPSLLFDRWLDASTNTLTKLTINNRGYMLGVLKLDLSRFKALTDLSLATFDSTEITCPPNLTRLSCASRHIGETFLPLPGSLTELICDLISPKIFEGLPLQVLEIGENSLLDDNWYKALPNTLRELTCHADWLNPRATMDSFSSVFSLPSLARFKVRGPIRFYMAELLMAAPSSVQVEVDEFELETMLNEPTIIASRARIATGELSSPFLKESYPYSMKRLIRTAYQRIITPGITPKMHPCYILPESVDWVGFMPLLSPDTKELHIHCMDVERDMTRLQWPSQLTSLTFDTLTSMPPQRGDFPGNLKFLTIDFTGDMLENLEFLPEGLTYLSIPKLDIAFPTHWPPQLTYLSVGLDESTICDAINSLPPTIEYLKVERAKLTFELALLLPPRLKVYTGPLEISPEFVELTRNRSISWAMSSEEFMECYQQLGVGNVDDWLDVHGSL